MTTRIIITGHSSGLGGALVQEWLRQGEKVVGLSRRGHPTLAQRYPEQLREYSLDLSSSQQLEQWLSSETFSHLCLDVSRLWLFNCAGTQSPAKRLGKQNTQEIADAVQLNIGAVLMLSNACYREIDIEKSKLSIVHISSGAAHKAYAGWSVYGASKAALDHHARSVMSENNPKLEIVSLAPGVVDTPMQQAIRDNETFPIRDRFLTLHKEGQLQHPSDTAQKIITYCQSSVFGSEAVVDIRQI